MKATVKKIKDCRVRMMVEVEAELVENRFQEVFRDFQRAARLPGFREGKAPMDLVQKKYAKEAEEEVLKSLIPEAYHRSVSSQKVAPVSLPSISDIKLERGKKLSFSAEFEESPEIPVKNYKGIRLRRAGVEVLPEDLEKGIESLLDSRAEIVPVEGPRAVRQGDFVVTDIEVWHDGRYVPSKKGVLLYVEPNPEDDFYEKVVGAASDEIKEITRPSSEEERALGIVGRVPHTKIHIRGIKQKKLPALNEEFAKSFGKDSVEALREAVRKDLATYKHSQSVEVMKSQLFEKLAGMVSPVLPEGLIEKQKERLVEQMRRRYAQSGAPEARIREEIEKVRDEIARKAKEQVKLYFTLRKIAELENIEIDEVELEQRLNGLAAESKRSLEEVRRVFEEDLRESMLEAKTVDFLIAHAKFEESK